MMTKFLFALMSLFIVTSTAWAGNIRHEGTLYIDISNLSTDNTATFNTVNYQFLNPNDFAVDVQVRVYWLIGEGPLLRHASGEPLGTISEGQLQFEDTVTLLANGTWNLQLTEFAPPWNYLLCGGENGAFTSNMECSEATIEVSWLDYTGGNNKKSSNSTEIKPIRGIAQIVHAVFDAALGKFSSIEILAQESLN